ncbi:MAG: tetratricopeptide repeat protein [Caldilineaceae bacterium]|nr:tetratricopeptide repeat protein [Caldilineaceae bacterium]
MATYTEIFTAYILNGARRALEQVQQGMGRVPDEVRLQAWHLLTYALTVEEAWPSVRELLLDLAPRMEMAGYRHEWLPFLQTGIKYSRLRDDKPITAELSLQLGYLQLRLRDFESAETALLAAQSEFVLLDNRPRQSLCLVRLAQVARYQNARNAALALLDDAEARIPPDVRETGYCHFVRGLLATDAHAWEEAVAHFQQSLDRWQAAGDRRQMALSFLNLGRARAYAYQYHPGPDPAPAPLLAEALAHTRNALDLFRAVNDYQHQASCYSQLGYLHAWQGDSQAALTMYTQAQSICHQTHDRLELAFVDRNLGVEYLKLGRYTEAQLAFEESIAGFEQTGHELEALVSREGWCEVYLAQGEYPQAIEALNRTLDRLTALMEQNPGDDDACTHLAAELRSFLAQAEEKMASVSTQTALNGDGAASTF